MKGKNLRLLHGIPLIAYSLRQAVSSGLFDVIAVSSDSNEILQAGLDHGATLAVTRPPEMASDTAAKLPVIQHCAREVEKVLGRRFSTFVDLDATSPLRATDDIVQAVALLEQSGQGNVITAMPARRSPYFNMVELDANGTPRLSKAPPGAVVRRQEAPQCYDMNASIYVWSREALLGGHSLFSDDTKLFVMPEERSIDIDTELDFILVEILMKRQLAEEA